MTPDEVRMLDNRYALLFIRGERPLIDEKYDLLKHPYVKYTTDGKGKPYQHGGTENAVASLAFGGTDLPKTSPNELAETNLSILSDEDIAAIFHIKKEDEQNETLE